MVATKKKAPAEPEKAKAKRGPKPIMENGQRYNIFLGTDDHRFASELGNTNVSLGIRLALEIARSVKNNGKA